jgi:Arc/MetJ-type ribon-helix-helix transcriptional regulator
MALSTNISVSIPIPWVDDITERADEKGYGSRSEYIRALIEQDIDEDQDTNVTIAVDGNGEEADA